MDTTPKTQKSVSALHTPSNDVDVNVSPFSCGRRTMSSSLRQKLKRSRRSFTSPQDVAKRLNVDSEDGPPASPTADDYSHLKDLNHNDKSPCERLTGQTPGPSTNSSQFRQTDILQLRDSLSREVKEKTETLRRLQMVKMYRKKNDLSQLRVLISKWRNCAQGVLYELQTALPTDGRKASLGQLMDHFGLEDRMLHYDRTEDDFRDL